MNYQTIELEVTNGIGTVWLNRPEVRNAMNEIVISELAQAARACEQDDRVRVVVLAGRGTAFCAGADLSWMKKMAGYSDAENIRDAQALADMLYTFYHLKKPTIARVHGPAYAGGMGLACTCDVIVAEPDAEFCLSEVKIGLIPSTISPYVIRALGSHQSRRYMLSGERMPAAEGYRLGFVHALSERGSIDDAIQKISTAFFSAGPVAISTTKGLLDWVERKPITANVINETALRIANVRASQEGKEGVGAFLEKRAPNWLSDCVKAS
ncbi:enoyl-CoA hydratase/isomerase family protein [Noviherbaspirillum sp. 1P10PC]|uniref:enoyl-CoA hydratase/isomerase family protein n=1 Tax=Noviherbaspirillum sp. 1P10PC TaxID=3132292 RepID=UPI00399FF2AD